MFITVQQNSSWQLSLAQLSPSLVKAISLFKRTNILLQKNQIGPSGDLKDLHPVELYLPLFVWYLKICLIQVLKCKSFSKIWLRKSSLSV